MFTRIVALKLKAESLHLRHDLAAKAKVVLGALPMVTSVRTGSPAQQSDATGWDLFFVVDLDDAASYPAYAAHPDHLRFLVEVIKPHVEFKKTWNFDQVP
jgi:hypothetical protein